MDNSGVQQSLFASRLRALMEVRNVSQSVLAQGVGVTRQTISLYCQGEAKPDIEKFVKIADFFKVPYDFLLGASNNLDKANADVGTITGLDDKAITVLKELMNDDKDYIISNLLIGSREFIDIVYWVREYLNDAFSSIGHDEIRDASLYRATRLFHDLLGILYERMKMNGGEARE